VNRFQRIFRRDASRNRLLIPSANRLSGQTLKTTLLSAIRSMAPTLLALSFAGVAHAQGTMDFSGATTLMTTFKTFAIYAGAVICFGGLIFAGIRMMSGRFQDAIPGLFGALFGAGVLGWGCRLDWFAHRADDAVGGGHDQARRTVTNQSGAQ
jgi:hypothetical protein